MALGRRSKHDAITLFHRLGARFVRQSSAGPDLALEHAVGLFPIRGILFARGPGMIL